MRPPMSSPANKPHRARRSVARSRRLDSTPSLHPMARRKMQLVGPEVPPVSMERADPLGRGDGHLIEVAAGAQGTLRPRPIPIDGMPRHHLLNLGAGSAMDVLLDDLWERSSVTRSAEIWVGPRARLRLVDRACGAGGSVDLLGIRLAPGASVELIGLRTGSAGSTVVAVDLAPGAKADLTWVGSATSASAVDIRVRGAGQAARHTLMLSAPLGPGVEAIRMAVATDRAGVPRCESVQMGAPHTPNLPGWGPALAPLGELVGGGPVELPPMPPKLRSILRRRAAVTQR